jgi:adenosylhomocysteine nucleosidase
MRVLVTFAVSEEFGPWQERHRFAPIQPEDSTMFHARVGEANVTALLTGIGPKIAKLSAAIVLSSAERAFDLCISTGLAGALQPAFAPGDVLAARAVVSGERDSKSNDNELLAHPRCLYLAEGCGAKIVERFRTSDHLILTAREKSLLAGAADAVEMESFEVLSEAMARGISGIAIRAVGDSAAEDLPLDFNQVVTPEGQISRGRIIAALLKRPTALPGLLRFARQSRDAAIALADYLDCYVAAVATNIQLNELEMEEAVAAT